MSKIVQIQTIVEQVGQYRLDVMYGLDEDGILYEWDRKSAKWIDPQRHDGGDE